MKICDELKQIDASTTINGQLAGRLASQSGMDAASVADYVRRMCGDAISASRLRKLVTTPDSRLPACLR